MIKVNLAWILGSLSILNATSVAQDASNTSGSENRDYAELNPRQGKQLLNAYCSRCHGINGKGAKGPDLTSLPLRRAKTDEDIVNTIANGLPGTGMPGFGPNYIDAYWHIVAYLREEQAKDRAGQKLPNGDPVHGYALFKEHKCAQCHWTGSEGGRLGPDLTKLAATPDYVRGSMQQPDAQIDGSYQWVQLLMEGGQILSGRRLHENSYFILLMNNQEELLSIRKQNVQEINRPHKSLMPSFAKTLSKQDIEDITTYVFTLRKD